MPRSPLQRALAALATPGALLALLAFFLPWYSISCDGFVLANATGYDSAVHGFRPPAAANPTLAFGAGPGSRAIPPPPPDAASSSPSDEHGDRWLVLLPLCAAAALASFVVAFARKSRRAVGIGSLFALAAAVVPMAHAVVLRSRVRDAIAQRSGADPMQRGVSFALERAVQFKLEHGWYLALVGGLVSAIAAGAWWFAATIAKPDEAPPR